MKASFDAEIFRVQVTIQALFQCQTLQGLCLVSVWATLLEGFLSRKFLISSLKFFKSDHDYVARRMS
jgi:hypothetical protein